MATCVDLSEATYPREYEGVSITPGEGKSLVPTFSGDMIERDAIYFEHEGNRAIRTGQWKLVAKGFTGRWQLYDIEKDRTELNNIAGQNPGLVNELSRQWEKWAKRTNNSSYSLS